jgi:hypothetical protein
VVPENAEDSQLGFLPTPDGFKVMLEAAGFVDVLVSASQLGDMKATTMEYGGGAKQYLAFSAVKPTVGTAASATDGGSAAVDAAAASAQEQGRTSVLHWLQKRDDEERARKRKRAKKKRQKAKKAMTASDGVEPVPLADA